MEDVLKQQKQAWDDENPNASDTVRRKQRPKYSVKQFYGWASQKSGPLKGKPYESSSVLVKTALNLHQDVKTFLGEKFGGSEEEATWATECFTRGSLGTGLFWNLKNVSAKVQLYWVKSMFEVQRCRKGRWDYKVKFKGTNVKSFERLCGWNVDQLTLLEKILADFKSNFAPSVYNRIMSPEKIGPKLKKIHVDMLRHRYWQSVQRHGTKCKAQLIDPLKLFVSNVRRQVKEEVLRQQKAEENQKKVAELLEAKKKAAAAKERTEALESGRQELKAMMGDCKDLIQARENDEEDEVNTLEAKCQDYAAKLQDFVTSVGFTDEADIEAARELQAQLDELLDQENSKFIFFFF